MAAAAQALSAVSGNLSQSSAPAKQEAPVPRNRLSTTHTLPPDPSTNPPVQREWRQHLQRLHPAIVRRKNLKVQQHPHHEVAY